MENSEPSKIPISFDQNILSLLWMCACVDDLTKVKLPNTYISTIINPVIHQNPDTISHEHLSLILSSSLPSFFSFFFNFPITYTLLFPTLPSVYLLYLFSSIKILTYKISRHHLPYCLPYFPKSLCEKVLKGRRDLEIRVFFSGRVKGGRVCGDICTDAETFGMRSRE